MGFPSGGLFRFLLAGAFVLGALVRCSNFGTDAVDTGGDASAGSCTIGGKVVAAGGINPDNACQSCIPTLDATRWSDANGTPCRDGLVCVGGQCVSGCYVDQVRWSNGDSNPTEACQRCDVAKSAIAWTNLADGTSCKDHTCASGKCTGCLLGEGSCASGGAVARCGDAGVTESPENCPSLLPTCTAGACQTTAFDGSLVVPPSCAKPGRGRSDCGPGGSGIESCCASLRVEAGTFYRTYDNDGTQVTGTNDLASVSAFRLDRYDVTVGRFRAFVAAVRAGYAPPAGSGKHVHLHGGSGLEDSNSPGTYEAGWLDNYSPLVDLTEANLQGGTWTAEPGEHESFPIDRVNWWEAYAFCIWDGGFLPSDAENEYAAAGGSDQRRYPYGGSAADPSAEYVIYDFNAPNHEIPNVGTASLGAGRWGQLDLTGEIWQWVLDWSAPFAASDDAANLSDSASARRVYRGGCATCSRGHQVVSAGRDGNQPQARGNWGFRCARTP